VFLHYSVFMDADCIFPFEHTLQFLFIYLFTLRQ